MLHPREPSPNIKWILPFSYIFFSLSILLNCWIFPFSYSFHDVIYGTVVETDLLYLRHLSEKVFMFYFLSVKKSNGFNVKIVVSGAKCLLMLFFPPSGPVRVTPGIQKGTNSIHLYFHIFLALHFLSYKYKPSTPQPWCERVFSKCVTKWLWMFQ